VSRYHTWEFIVPMPKLDSSGRNFNGGGNYSLLNTTISALRAKNRELSCALARWQPLIHKTLYSIRKLTNMPEEDLLQGLLEYLLRVDLSYNTPMFRYRGHVWEMESVSGRLVRLVAVKTAIKKRNPVWTTIDLIEPVKKSAYPSLIYRKIVQYPWNVARIHFSRKRGYSIQYETQTTICRSGHVTSLRTTQKRIPKRLYQIISLSELPHPENVLGGVSLDFTLDSTPSRLSPEKQLVLCLQNQLRYIDRSRKACSNLKKRMQRLMVEMQRRSNPPIYPSGVFPVHFKYGFMRQE
jgi:hypothetical protein